ncbi:DUF3800 domain-containing protein [Limosilactobacillus oris]|uniref:DUF3800 domain-containing protein n=1 Tax=Limosilactobacillus oris TaxID=1632 RepID=UPI00243059C5|nr:DUF3800 domain-containing protein [Limosilactobacillus oris]
MDRFTDVYFFIDDSGVFDFAKNEEYFLYCGYMIIGNQNKDNLLRKYNAVRDEIAKEYLNEKEIKGRIFDKNIGHQLRDQLRLYKVMKSDYCYSLILKVKNKAIYPYILKDKKSKTRYKNYALKMMIKEALQQALKDGAVEDTLLNIKILVDEEGQSTNGIYDLEESVRSELFHGVRNFDYGTFYEPLFHNQKSSVKVTYCRSEVVRPVQTADILANLCYFFLHNDGYNINYFTRRDRCIYKVLPF